MNHETFDPAAARVGVFEALLRAKARVGGRAKMLEDHDRKPLSYTEIIRAAFALGGRLKARTRKGETVGVLLPTGVGAAVVFFALSAIGRVPAMLNFTAGSLNLKAACKAAGIRTILTADRFIEQAKLEDLTAELGSVADVVKLEAIRAKIGLGDKLGALIKGMAPRAFAHKPHPDDTAVILFTSGSFGAPRGVALSHANLVSNAAQAYAHIRFEPDWVFFNPLPMFHCFGLTAGTLLPLLAGHKVFVYPSPLHFKEIPKLVEETGASILFATDTFASQYARAAKSGELSSLKFAVLGAERVREETREMFDRFGVLLLEGYGATECSPVVSVNQPEDNRPGTVGRPLPGQELKLEPVPGIEEGQRLLVRGPNVMKGYLAADGSGAIEPPADGWHDTGDVVSIDEAGCIIIRGRVKRFAKIGGEMVSLAAVEGYAAAVWPEARHAAVAVACPRKGEKVVLVTDQAEADPAALMSWAQTHGAPEIALPKRIVAAREIPVLGSGKTDYVAVQRMAEQQDVPAEAA